MKLWLMCIKAYLHKVITLKNQHESIHTGQSLYLTVKIKTSHNDCASN